MATLTAQDLTLATRLDLSNMAAAQTKKLHLWGLGLLMLAIAADFILRPKAKMKSNGRRGRGRKSGFRKNSGSRRAAPVVAVPLTKVRANSGIERPCMLGDSMPPHKVADYIDSYYGLLIYRARYTGITLSVTKREFIGFMKRLLGAYRRRSTSNPRHLRPEMKAALLRGAFGPLPTNEVERGWFVAQLLDMAQGLAETDQDW